MLGAKPVTMSDSDGFIYVKDGITKETMREFISNLDIPADAKASLMELTPATYIGKAVELARRC